MGWVYLSVAAVVAVEVLGVRRFYVAWGRNHELCHGDQPWRGEYIANFGHPPEDARIPRPLAVPRVRRARRPPRRLRPTLHRRPRALRPAAS